MKYKTATDKELWERCQSQNDELAYAEIFRRYFPRMLRVAARYVNDSMQAEELVMDAFFKLWDKRERINLEGELSSYLSGCVHNTVVSSLEKALPDSIGLDMIENTFQADRETDSHIIYEDIRRIYCTALNKLSPRRRQVFQMSREENLTYAEIAQKMNLSVGTVENYMVAALDGLRMNMKGYISILLLFLFSAF